MEIKKGNRFVCVKDSIAPEFYTKGNVYVSENDGCITCNKADKNHRWPDGAEKHFIPYSKLDRVYTKATDRLVKLHGSCPTDNSVTYFDNFDYDFNTGNFDWASLDESYYTDKNYTYLSEQAFIEFMGLLPGQANYTSMSMYLKSDKSDTVNKPSHYNNGSIEPIDYITANSMNFLEGNVVKYVTRYKFKNGLEDLKKAEFYLKRLIEEYKS